MGNKKFLLVAFVLAALVGCDQGGEKKDVSAVQDSKTASTTALYLPGGAGLDFGKAAQKDLISVVGENKYKVFVYEFEDSIQLVDSAVAEILLADGYSRVQQSSSNEAMLVSYSAKEGIPVIFRYKVVVEEGFSKKTVLHLSWALKDLDN